MPAGAYLAVWMAALALLVYTPTHLLLRSCRFREPVSAEAGRQGNLDAPTASRLRTNRFPFDRLFGKPPHPMQVNKLAQLCRELAENKKAEDVVVLDVSKLSSVTDYFVIATGTSDPHLRAIENEVLDRLREEHGVRPNNTDSQAGASWVVADFFDVILHIMKPETRAQYDLEGLWGDAVRVPKARARKKQAAAADEPTAAGETA
jgi:ribosome-associated protein